jgi:hypothetical protein
MDAGIFISAATDRLAAPARLDDNATARCHSARLHNTALSVVIAPAAMAALIPTVMALLNGDTVAAGANDYFRGCGQCTDKRRGNDCTHNCKLHIQLLLFPVSKERRAGALVA